MGALFLVKSKPGQNGYQMMYSPGDSMRPVYTMNGNGSASRICCLFQCIVPGDHASKMISLSERPEVP